MFDLFDRWCRWGEMNFMTISRKYIKCLWIIHIISNLNALTPYQTNNINLYLLFSLFVSQKYRYFILLRIYFTLQLQTIQHTHLNVDPTIGSPTAQLHLSQCHNINCFEDCCFHLIMYVGMHHLFHKNAQQIQYIIIHTTWYFIINKYGIDEI